MRLKIKLISLALIMGLTMALYSCRQNQSGDEISFKPLKTVYIPEWKNVLHNFRFSAVAVGGKNRFSWVAGEGGIIMRSENGKDWIRDKTGCQVADGNDINSVLGLKDGSAWAVGSNGLIMHFQKRTGWKEDLQAEKIAGISNLTDICIGKDHSLWVLGYNTLLKFDVKDGWRNVLPIGQSNGIEPIRLLPYKEDGVLILSRRSQVIQYTPKDGFKKFDYSKVKIGRHAYATFNAIIHGTNNEIWIAGDYRDFWKFKSFSEWRDDSLSLKNLTDSSGFNSMVKQPNGKIWGAGYNGIFSCDPKGVWIREPIPIPEQSFFQIAANDSMAIAVGYNKIWTKEANKDWISCNIPSSKFANDTLLKVKAVEDGNAWILAKSGIIFHYSKENDWHKDSVGSSLAKGFELISMSANKKGDLWVLGENRSSGIINPPKLCLHYNKEEGWQRVLKTADLKNVSEIGVGEDQSVWIAGYQNTLHFTPNLGWKYEDSISKKIYLPIRQIKVTNNDGVWFLSSMSSGTNVSILRPDSNLKTIGADCGREFCTLNALSISDSGDAWLAGSAFLHYQNNAWKIDEQGTALLDRTAISGIECFSNGKVWALGKNGFYFYSPNFGWTRDLSAKRDWGFTDNAFSIRSDGSGLAIGPYGQVNELTIKSPPILNSIAKNDIGALYNFRDSARLSFSGHVYGMELNISPSDDQSTDFLKGVENAYKVSVDSHQREISLVFSPNAPKSFTALQGRSARIRLHVKVHQYLPIWQDYESNVFLVGKSGWEDHLFASVAIIGVIAVILNILIVLLAIRFSWFRRNVFSDNFDSMFDLFSIKGLATRPLLVLIPRLKMAILTSYRKELTARPDLKQWSNGRKQYNPPQIDGIENDLVIHDLWNKIATTTKNNLWLVEGPSGLGKTALLEQLTLQALSSGYTPLLIKLNNSQSDSKILSEQFFDYGQLRIDENTAVDMVINGGFVLIFDGLNEARVTDGVFRLIKSVIRKNIVVLSSQYEPDWQEIQKDKVLIRPFGRPQINRLLEQQFEKSEGAFKIQDAQRFVDELLDADYLFDGNSSLFERESSVDKVYILPFTAVLIGDFIQKNAALPHNRLVIYYALTDQLRTDEQYLNFEQKAWHMFIANQKNILPDNDDDAIDYQFLQHARIRGMVTTYSVKETIIFRFRHERISRFLVSCYLFRTLDVIDLKEMHKQLTKGQDRLHWADICEFYGELLVNDIRSHRPAVERYKAFLLHVGDFEPLILKKRLIVQWRRLCSQHPEVRDENFESQLLVKLVREGDDI